MRLFSGFWHAILRWVFIPVVKLGKVLFEAWSSSGAVLKSLMLCAPVFGLWGLAKAGIQYGLGKLFLYFQNRSTFGGWYEGANDMVSDFLKLSNACVNGHLIEMCYDVAFLLSIWVGVKTYRFVKSWIPTVPGA